LLAAGVGETAEQREEVLANNRLRRDIRHGDASFLDWHAPQYACHTASPYTVKYIMKEANHMKLSARNVLKGKIVEIARASTMTRVSLDIGGGNIVNAAITTVAVDDLKLAVGKEAYAVVDSTNVMVGID
jgi:molybdopterin-binding protein